MLRPTDSFPFQLSDSLARPHGWRDLPTHIVSSPLANPPNRPFSRTPQRETRSSNWKADLSFLILSFSASGGAIPLWPEIALSIVLSTRLCTLYSRNLYGPLGGRQLDSLDPGTVLDQARSLRGVTINYCPPYRNRPSVSDLARIWILMDPVYPERASTFRTKRLRALFPRALPPSNNSGQDIVEQSLLVGNAFTAVDMKFQPVRQPTEGVTRAHMKRLVPLCILGVFFILYRNAIAGVSGPDNSASLVDKIPRKIWQSWKNDPFTMELRDSERAKTWTTKNPNYRYEVLTDDNAMGYVEYHYGPHQLNRPDIIHTYRTISDKIIKSDLLRYLIMYGELISEVSLCRRLLTTGVHSRGRCLGRH